MFYYQIISLNLNKAYLANIYKMLSNSWSIKLSQQPIHSTVSYLPTPSIIYQGISNQLICFTNNQSIPLPIRKQVLALQSLPSNQILILTRYDLTCFDLNNNDQVFTKQFENAQKLWVSENYVYVSCGSDLFCYTHLGQQQYVNHLSNNLISLEIYHGSQGEQVVIGMQDMSMLRYKGVNITFDYTKVVGTPVSLCWIQSGVMVGTEEGTIAFYQSKKSKWKAKSTHPVFNIINFKKQQTSNALVVRKNGTIQLRDWKKGQTINKIKVGQVIISLHLCDFRKQGLTQIICVCKSSSVKAFNLQEQLQQVNNIKIGDQIQDEIKKIGVLLRQKAELEYEVNQLNQELQRKQDENEVNGETPLSEEFKIQALMMYRNGLTLDIKCTNGFISALSFEQPILPITFERAEKISYVFQNQNKIAGEILCEALVHSSYSTKSYEIRNFKIHLSKFWHWGLTSESRKQIQGFVKFDLIERNARYIKWMQECFFFDANEAVIAKMQTSPLLKVRFFNYYQNQQLQLIFKSKQGKVEIWCDSLQILGSVFQDLIEYTGVKQLDSELSFPKEKQKLKDILNNIEKLSQTKLSINSQMAEAVNNIKFLLVKGESALAVGNLNDLRKSYGEIMNQNKGIMMEIQKKNLNTINLSDSLKILGKFINMTSNVRFGKPKQTIIQHCREAIKKKDFPKIVSIMQRGMSAIV